MTAERARLAHVVRLYLAIVSAAVGTPALLCFYWLRETPIFWTNAGGYPIWLRDLVRDAFLPLLGMDGMALLLYVALFHRYPPRSARVARGGDRGDPGHGGRARRHRPAGGA